VLNGIAVNSERVIMNTEATGLRATSYLRKSSVDPRAGANRSIQDQRFECERLVDRHGLTVVEVYREKVGTSASRFKTNRRPQLERALEDMGTWTASHR
jgi:DNA invertase Pin-like site-specific DNA recombinase